MIFSNRAYQIPIKTNNGTNTKDYSLIFDNHSISIDFILNDQIENESAIFVREGGDMGLYVEAPNSIKFIWKEKSGEINKIQTIIENIKEKYNVTININDHIEFYINGTLIDKTIKGSIINCADKKLVIGAEQPYRESNEKWFSGEILGFTLYEDFVGKTEKNVYINLDFVNNSKFKTFDKSGSGNHGVLFENPKDVEFSITEYNKLGPKQKII